MNGAVIPGAGLRAGLGLALLALAACQPSYGGVDISRIAGHPDSQASEFRVSVPEGGLVVFEAELLARDDAQYDALDELHFESSTPGTATVVQGLKNHTWMVLGEGVGEAELLVLVNGRVEGTVALEVTEPQEELWP